MELREISKQLQSVIAHFSKLFVGRERTIRLIVLSLVSQQHIYMVSPPGTGKTMMEQVARAFNMSTFYYLYNYDVKLEDILYNPVITKIPVADTGEKIVIDYELRDPGIGTSEIHFADEMFKAPTPVLNALLGIMNERRATLGNKEIKVPLVTLIAASNELPEGAEALLDRFLFRDFLKYLEVDQWYEYLVQYWNIHQPSFSFTAAKVPKDIVLGAYQLLPSVDIFGILDDYTKVLSKLKDRNIEVSDRRKGRILFALASSAVIAGRMEVYPEDLEVLLYTVPTTEEQLEVVKKVVDEFLGGILKLKEDLENTIKQFNDLAANARSMSLEELSRVSWDLVKAKNRLLQLSVNSSMQYLLDKVSDSIDRAEEQIVDAIAEKITRV